MDGTGPETGLQASYLQYRPKVQPECSAGDGYTYNKAQAKTYTEPSLSLNGGPGQRVLPGEAVQGNQGQ